MAEREPDRVERDALARDESLLRRVRWRLVAWSGGITLVILVILGAAFYAVASSFLESSSLARLEARAGQLAPSELRDLDDLPPLQVVMGGESSGTFAYLLSSDGQVFRPPFDGPRELPDEASLGVAAVEGRDVRTVVVDGVPFRLLSLRASGSVVDLAGGGVPITAVQIVEDRSAEQGSLDRILEVMVIGGGLAVLVAMIAGAVYSGRALVPIRDSLAAQRRALRRQREFAADASHELRTPLTIIRASVDDLRQHADEPVRAVGAALEDIEAEVGQISSLVDDLLLLARSDSGALDLVFEPVELGDIAVRAAAAMSGPASRSGVTIVVDPEPVMVSGDPVRLRQLVTILVDNAVRHSAQDGTVEVRVREHDRGAKLTIDDQGAGIDAAGLSHVFDRFWHGRRKDVESTGLGLAIAHAIVIRHGGQIAASNRPQGGARFTVRLPLQEPPSFVA